MSRYTLPVEFRRPAFAKFKNQLIVEIIEIYWFCIIFIIWMVGAPIRFSQPGAFFCKWKNVLIGTIYTQYTLRLIAITNDFINFQQFQQLMDFSEIVENTHFLQYVGARWSLVRYEPSGKLTF